LGFSDEEIGKIFQCSQYTVRSFRWKHNIYNRNRQWQERLPKKVYLQLRQQKLSLSEISAITDVPYYTVVKAKKLYE
jgi:DNA-directed RNA polymerase specialized sigma24 family protein